MMISKIATKVGQYLSFFCEKISFQELSKIARSGHTLREINKFDST